MLPVEIFNKFLLLLPFAHKPAHLILGPGNGDGNGNGNDHSDDNGASESSWSYENTYEWGNNYRECNGNRQSPIHLRTTSSILAPLPGIIFGNYNTPLAGPLTLTNNGHSVSMSVGTTTSGGRPYITGGLLKNRFYIDSFHFHWGSPGERGSEHTINNRRYDVEMHLVHINEKYSSVDEAGQHRDGLSVIGVMFNIVKNPDRTYPGLNKIFNQVPNVIQNGQSATLSGTLTMRQLLGDTNTKDFFTYQGSLTTPPCSQAVTFIIFPKALQLPYEQISRFFDTFDSHGEPMVNNYRPIQPTNNRPVFYRAGTNNYLSFFDSFKNSA